MQLDILSTIQPDLYPFQSVHQAEIEAYFGQSLLRDLSPRDVEDLGKLDLFLVAFTNRSGSTLLTSIMHQVGFGIPPRAEIFNGDDVTKVCKEHRITSFTDYFLRVIYGWRKNQRVGLKIGARQLFWLTRTGLLTRFRSVKIINCKRQDRISQAISLYIALQTGQWHSQMEIKDDIEPPSYSRKEILHCLHTIHQGQQLIEYYADIHNVPILGVDYENIVSNPDREIQRLAHFLGAPHGIDLPVDTDAVDIKQQRNKDNSRLYSLFEQDFFTQ